MTFEVETITGIIRYKQPPNGGWAWVVLVASFLVFANAFGTSKSLGIYFLDIKFEFDANNSDTSWISSLFLGALGLAGMFNSLISKWLDSRMTIILGGLLACIGMIIAAFSPSFAPLYVGCFMAGIGHGLAFVTCTSQLSLYFGKLRPLASGIMLSGSSVASAIMPYLNNYLLKVYGWRGSFFVLAAVGLHTCVMGSLIRPIKMVSDDAGKQHTDNEENTDKVRTEKDYSAIVKSPNKINVFSIFSKYWVAICLLFSNIIACLVMFVPNIYLVPYSRDLNFTGDDGALLLSLISIGDIVFRPLTGVIITHFSKVSANPILFIAILASLLSANQLLAIFGKVFAVLILYVLLHGCFYGAFSTICVTSVAALMGAKDSARFYGIFFASGSFAILSSGPIAGALVDHFGRYEVAYWYTLICLSTTAILVLLLHIIVIVRGGVVVETKKLEGTAKRKKTSLPL